MEKEIDFYVIEVALYLYFFLVSKPQSFNKAKFLGRNQLFFQVNFYPLFT